MHNGLTAKHAAAYAYADKLHHTRLGNTLTIPSAMWDLLHEAENIERKALRFPPLPRHKLELRGSKWRGINLKRGR